MKRISPHDALLALALPFASSFAAAASTLNVHVQNPAGAPVASAQVVALFFNNGNPDPTASRLGATDASGNASIATLVDGDFYQVVAASQGWTPSIVDQFNTGAAPGFAASPSTPTAVTIVLSTGAAGSIGEIDSPVTAATPNSILFGQVGLQAGGGAVAFGVAATGAGGAGTMSFYNVGFASGGVYQVSAFDSVANHSASAPIGANFFASPFVGPTLNFTNAPPPVTTISQNQLAGASAGLSVYGVVQDTAGASVPFIWFDFSAQYKDPFGQIRYDWRGANTDQNGVFQLYGLIPGVTYYANIPPACNGQNGRCYQGWQSTAGVSGVYGAAPAANDFLYMTTATVQNQTITLSQMPPGSGKLAVYVKDQYGNAFPQAGIGLWPDWSQWQLTPTPFPPFCGNPQVQNPGMATVNLNNTTGYALITGLTSGNYMLSVWTPFGQTMFNAGTDGQFHYSGPSCGGSDSDDVRLTIDTTSAGGDAFVYDAVGNVIRNGVWTVTVTVNISTSASGQVAGTISFPSQAGSTLDLSRSPISVILYPQCTPGSPCQNNGGYVAFSSTAQPTSAQNYSIPVSSGSAYWMEIQSDYWGAIYPGGGQPQPNLISTNTAVVNLQFLPAGRVRGYLRKPDGSVYVPPTNSGGLSINAEGNNAWGWGQLLSDGSFVISGLLPGTYNMRASAWGGSFPYATRVPLPRATVQANQDTTLDVYLDNAVDVKPVVALSSLPAFGIVNCPMNAHGDCPPEDWRVYAAPAGSPFTATNVQNLLANVGGGAPGIFSYSPSTSAGQAYIEGCNGQFLPGAGFCRNELNVTGTAGSSYDFYLLRSGGFDSGSFAGGVRPFFVIESSTKSVVVSQAATQPGSPSAGVAFDPNGPTGSTTPVQRVDLTPSANLSGVPQATLSGTVTISNMINQRQFGQLGGSFEKFLSYLPVVWAYDSSGTLRGAGLVVPFPPAEAPLNDQLQKAVALGNFPAFQTLLGPAPAGWGPVGYEIRGLTAGQSYNLLVTTPNYPPYKTAATLGAANSTTTVNVNLDQNPGGTLAGVVQSTSGVAVAGAQVTVKASGYGATTLTTASDGSWSVGGLAAGAYQLVADAAGYAEQVQTVNVAGSGTTNAPAFSLPVVNSSLAGTVYTNNPVCPPKTVCPAFGKTVLQGITVFAYDDTLNAANPTAALSLYRAVTDSSGVYRLNGLSTALIAGTTNYHQFKVFVNAPGYYVLNQSTPLAPGGVTGFDLALKPKPLDVNVFGSPAGANYEFQITNFKSFSDGNAWISPGLTFSSATSQLLPKSYFTQRPDAQGNQQLFLDYPLAGPPIALATGTAYTLHIVAQPNDSRAAPVIKDVPFGLNLPHNTCQNIDAALIGDDAGVNAQGLPNNMVPLDIAGGAGGNASGLSLPAGGVIPIASTAVPSMCMSETDAAASTQAAVGASSGAFASGVYSVTLSSVNYTQKGVDLTLSYKQNGTSLGDLAVFTFDNASQQWKSVPGTQTIDPVRGTISVKGLKSLASVLRVGEAGTGLMAASDGRGYRPNAIILRPDDSGLFAIMKPSLLASSAFSGTTIKIYNFPNPFSLETKTVSLNTTATNACATAGLPASVTTDGTAIKLEVPGGISGHGVLRVYTISGRLVRELDEGTLTGGNCYYTNWDGRNKTGQPVANGVYYGVLSVSGSKVKDSVFKMAVIK